MHTHTLCANFGLNAHSWVGDRFSLEVETLVNAFQVERQSQEALTASRPLVTK